MNFARSLSAYSPSDKLDTQLFFKCQVSIWYLECTGKAWICFYLSTAKGRLFSWFQYYTANVRLEISEKYAESFRKWQIRALSNAGLFIIFSTVGTGYCIVGPKELQDLVSVVNTPIPHDSPALLFAQIYNILLMFIMSCVAMLPLCLYFAICLLLYMEYKQLEQDIKAKIGSLHISYSDITYPL